VPGLQDAVLEGETGWLVDRAGSLALTIVEALHTLSDPEQAQEWRSRAISWADQFDWEWTTQRIEALLSHEASRLGRVARSGRVGHKGRDLRARSDLACRVDLPLNDRNLKGIQDICRQTDVWRRDREHLTALLHGADEDGVRTALSRAGVKDHAEIRAARAGDWLLGGVPPGNG
jgi:hypothetical protein